MNKVEYPSLRTHIFEDTLPNGLKVIVVPKVGFSKSFAVLATKYGSVDSVFEADGKWEKTPDGVAHFLEHKVFEQPDGTNALQLFSATGASPNAFTSNTMTAYHFECTDEFERNLEILLDYVYSPYFTDENVEKEQGIIAQEIGMIEDNPHWKVHVNLFASLYENHTINVSVAGSVESISEITKETLYLCHKSFYSPCNMVLVACTDKDPQFIYDMALKMTPKENVKIADREYGNEGENAFKPVTEIKMAVNTPLFMIGYKDFDIGENIYRHETLAEISASCLFSSSTKVYSDLYEKGLINRSFGQGYLMFPEGGTMVCEGESRDPMAVKEAFANEIIRISEEGVDTELFERVKKSAYGLKIRTLDSVSDLGISVLDAYFKNASYFEFDKIFDSITVADVNSYLSKFKDPQKSAISIVNPL